MPKRTDISSILVIGAGPIIIGQACEFDYSGTQAIKALKEEGYRIILVNSNPATIMTDPELADATYIEPVTPEIVAKIIEKERPDAVLPTMGGQTALNVALALDDLGDGFGRDRLDIGGVGQPRIGHDRGRIGIHQDYAIALFAQRLARLGARVVELAGLTDDDRAGADDQDRFDVGALRHRASESSPE